MSLTPPQRAMKIDKVPTKKDRDKADLDAIVHERLRAKVACDNLHKALNRLEALIKGVVSSQKMRNGHDT